MGHNSRILSWTECALVLFYSKYNNKKEQMPNQKQNFIKILQADQKYLQNQVRNHGETIQGAVKKNLADFFCNTL
jgi:hypothetical protein